MKVHHLTDVYQRVCSFALCLLALFGGGALSATFAQEKSNAVVVVGDRVVFTLQSGVGSITPLERAGIVNARIERVLSDPELLPESLEVQEPVSPEEDLLITVSGLPIIGITQADALFEDATREELAERWGRALREALIEVKPLHRPGEHESISFMPLLLVSGLAFAVPLLVSRFRRFPVPIVVGEILLGMLIGRSGLDLVRYDSWLQFLAEFGFAYLMFLAGLEVDIDLLRPARAKNGSAKNSAKAGEPRIGVLALAFLTFGLTLALAFGVALALTASGLITQPWLMALVLSTTSLGLAVPTLKERNLSSTPFGQMILLSALIADFLTMFLITVVAGWLSSGPTLKLFLGLLLLAVFALAVRIGSALKSSSLLADIFASVSQATAQISVRGSLFLMLAFVALSSQLGTEVILGAFLAGVLLALFVREGSSDLHHKLEALGFGFFIPIFFVMVGVRFDLSALTGSPQGMMLAPLLIGSALAIKVLACLPFRFMVSWRETFAGGFLMASRLSLIIAAAEIGQRLGLFPKELHAALIAVALVTAIVGPLGFQLLLPSRDEAPVKGAA